MPLLFSSIRLTEKIPMRQTTYGPVTSLQNGTLGTHRSSLVFIRPFSLETPDASVMKQLEAPDMGGNGNANDFSI